MGLEWATCCLSNMLEFKIGKIVHTEHATNKKCTESQCSREQWANGKTSAPPGYVQQELFFFLSQNTCDLFILFHMGQFLGKGRVRGGGLCSTRKCRRGRWAEVSNALAHGAGSWPSPAAPLLTQHSLCLHSLLMGTSVLFLLQAFSSPEPCKLLALILRVFISCGKHLYWCTRCWTNSNFFFSFLKCF